MPAAARSAAVRAASSLPREHDGTVTRPHAIAIDVAAHGAGEHHTRTVVIAEHDGALDAAGGQHGPLGEDAPGALARLEGRRFGIVISHALDRDEGLLVVAAEQRCTAENADVGQALKLGLDRVEPMQRVLAVDLLPVVEQAAAEAEILLDQQHACARTSGGQRRHQARGAGADHQHVAMDGGFLVTVGILDAGRTAKSGRAPDHRLIQLFPEGRRPHKGLVVEARRDQRAGDAVDRHQIECQRRPAVLARGDEAVIELDLSRARVGLAACTGAQFDERVGFFRTCRQEAARPVIFERASDEANAVGKQGGGERVARMARILGAVEAEAERAAAVDEAAGAVAGRLAGHRVLPPGAARTPTISCVRVSRVTSSHARQPDT